MNIARKFVNFGALTASLLALTAANAEVSRSKELTCSGTVSYGQETFSDQIVLRFSDSDVEVSGEAWMTSTFEGMLRYKICFESENEVNFEYTTSQQCGNTSTRTGYLQKVVGSLRLTRSDIGEPFVGNYKCKPAQRVLN